MAITNPSAEDYYSYAYQGVKKNIHSQDICQGSEDSLHSKFRLPKNYCKGLCTPIADNFLQQHSEEVLSIITSNSSRYNYILFSIFILDEDNVIKAIRYQINPELEEKARKFFKEKKGDKVFQEIEQLGSNGEIGNAPSVISQFSAIGVFGNFLL
ncbi:DUF4359 domain-containing protein [Nostoc sp.]|uniref:DUF4359 domain-containing protein n=1 Tax=Nostoc sp. TaxID=1180 RepID=UPI002FF907A5